MKRRWHRRDGPCHGRAVRTTVRPGGASDVEILNLYSSCPPPSPLRALRALVLNGMTKKHAMELPHTPGCLACGRENPHGLHLHLHVDPAGVVTTRFVPSEHHIGFQGVAHGGVLATVLDEAMVWAASWAGRRFCLCGEMTVRFRQPALVGMPLVIEARVEVNRSRIV